MQKQIPSRFNQASTTTDSLQGMDLNGKRALVTGGNAGLGTETTRTLAETGAEVIITTRKEEDGIQSVQKLQEATGKDCISYELLDLSSSQSSVQLAETVIEKYSSLDLLILNAGVMGVSYAKLSLGQRDQS